MEFTLLPAETRYHIYSYLDIINLRTILRVNSVEREITRPLFRKVTAIHYRTMAVNGTPTEHQFHIELLTKNTSIAKLNSSIFGSNDYSINIESVINIGIPLILILYEGNHITAHIFNNEGKFKHKIEFGHSFLLFDANLNALSFDDAIRHIIIHKIRKHMTSNNYLLYVGRIRTADTSSGVSS